VKSEKISHDLKSPLFTFRFSLFTLVVTGRKVTTNARKRLTELTFFLKSSEILLIIKDKETKLRKIILFQPFFCAIHQKYRGKETFYLILMLI
jgi:hypothetical protein